MIQSDAAWKAPGLSIDAMQTLFDWILVRLHSWCLDCSLNFVLVDMPCVNVVRVSGFDGPEIQNGCSAYCQDRHHANGIHWKGD